MKKLFVGALLASSVLPAFAAISLVNYDGFVVVQSGNTWNFHHESAENTALKGGTVYGRAGATVSTTQPLTVGTRGVVAVGKGAVVDVAAKIPRANMARALIAAAKIGRIAAGPVAYLATEALLDYGLKNVSLGDDGNLKAESPDSNSVLSDGNEYYYSDLSGGYSTPQAACNAYALKKGGAFFSVDKDFCTWTNPDGGRSATGAPAKRTSSTCPAGKYWISYTTCSDKPEMRSMSEQEIYDKLAASSDWPSSSALALQGMLSYPDTRKILTPYPDNGVTLIGQPSVQGKTSTSTDTVQLVPGTNTVAPPGATQTQTGTRTTTTTATHPLTYSGNSVTSSTINNTTTNITNNTTNVTTTENKTETVEDDSEEQTPSDAPLGDVPKLYEKKYPDGLLGVWDAKKSEFEQTSFFRMIGELTPKIGQAGSCPSWSIDLSWTPGASMGVHQLQPPCMIWPILKTIVIISALFLARALIFGG